MTEDQAERTKVSNITEVVKATTALVDKIPIYQDAIQPFAKETGKALGTVGKAVNAALFPIRSLIWGIEQIEDFVTVKVAKRLQNTPLENIQTPDLAVAGPVLESLRYTGHKESLSDMYANLLATSMDSETARNAHPGFVEIIRNLSSDEAKIVAFLIQSGTQPVVDVQSRKKGGIGDVDIGLYGCDIAEDAGAEHRDLIGTYLKNLERLGLVEIPKNLSIAIDDVYDKILNSKEIKELESKITAQNDYEVRYVKYLVKISTLGRQFAKACVIGKTNVSY